MSDNQRDGQKRQRYWWAVKLLLVWLAIGLVASVVLIERYTVSQLSRQDLSKRHFTYGRIRWTNWRWLVSDPVVEQTHLSEWISNEIPEVAERDGSSLEFETARILSHWDGDSGPGPAAMLSSGLYALSDFHPQSHFPCHRSGDDFWTSWSQSHADEATEFWVDVLHALHQGHPDYASLLVAHKRSELLTAVGNDGEVPAEWMRQ